MFQFLLLSLVAVSSVAWSTYPESDPVQSDRPVSVADRYRERADRIIAAALAGNDAFAKLEHLTLRIGHRLSGSPQLDQAIDWAVAAMKKDGQENVRREPVMVPHWVRGKESATLIEPRKSTMQMLGLGGSVGTPPEGITAPVVVVADSDGLDALGDGAAGKIVLFNKVMPPYDPVRGSRYGETVKYRHIGAALAAERGAVACLVRSVTARSLRSPHTGAMSYRDAKVKIPAAALSVEDAELIVRLAAAGEKVVVNLKMEAQTLPDAESANVIGELRGSTAPDEIIAIGGHIDSWDVGQGAHDDGAGIVMAMEAIHVLRKLNLIPRRTIRVVLWTNEENGLAGGKAYAIEHAGELVKHVAAIETDSGGFKPREYSVGCDDPGKQGVAVEQVGEILRLFESKIGPMTVEAGGDGGADISPMKRADVVLMGHEVHGDTYFDYHHTDADTIDKVDPLELSQNVAVLATVAYILADMPERLGSPFGVDAPTGTK